MIVKQNFPHIKVNTSINSKIRSKEDVRRYMLLGVDRLTLHHDINRDFGLLKEIRATTEIPIELLSNNACLYDCIYASNHMNIDAHASIWSSTERNTGFPRLNCKDIRLRDNS